MRSQRVRARSPACIAGRPPALRAGSTAGRTSSFLLLLVLALTARAADWQNNLTKDPPGHFPPLRSLRAKYAFGWSGITAATADVHFTPSGDNRTVLEGNGHTTGFVRALWRYDVNYQSLADGAALRPIESKQIDTYRGKKITTNLAFNNNGVARARNDTSASGGPTKPKRFDFPNLYDLQSVLLYLRSQPLKDRSVYRVAVYPETNAYLATVTVTGREKISVRAGSYSAIKFDLRLNKIDKNLQLTPHKKFRRATIWISDDSDRMLLRIEAQVFVGTVFAELQSVQFER